MPDCIETSDGRSYPAVRPPAPDLHALARRIGTPPSAFRRSVDWTIAELDAVSVEANEPIDDEKVEHARRLAAASCP